MFGVSDESLLLQCQEANGVRLLECRSGEQVAIRVTEGRGVPILIVNGLAATMATIGKLHEALHEATGRSVVSYDRPGVGFSPDVKGATTWQGAVEDMFDVMAHVHPDVPWLLIGASMGTVLVQCFLGSYPHRCASYFNLDGFPAPFSAKEKKFQGASSFYGVFSWFAWAGLLRPLLWMADGFFDKFAGKAFSSSVMRSQMNSSRFWTSTQREFKLMIDLATRATELWGSLNVLSLPDGCVDDLARNRPRCCGAFENGQWTELPRSNAELGDDWVEPSLQTSDGTRLVIEESPLACILSKIPVVVMSARQYAYIGGNTFYDAEMKRWAAAEHSLHVLVSCRGSRYVFPQVGHDSIFTHTAAILACIQELDGGVNE